MADLAQIFSETDDFLLKDIALDDDIEQSLAELQAAADKCSHLVRENAHKDGEIKVLREQESNTQSEIKHLRQENESLKVDSALAKREAAENAKAKDDMSTKYYVTRKEKNEMINKLKTELADAKADMEAIRAKGDDLQTKMEGLVKQNDQLIVEKQELEQCLKRAAQKPQKTKKQSASSPTSLVPLAERFPQIPKEVVQHFECKRHQSSNPKKIGKVSKYVYKEDGKTAFTNITSCRMFLMERGIIPNDGSKAGSSSKNAEGDDRPNQQAGSDDVDRRSSGDDDDARENDTDSDEIQASEKSTELDAADNRASGESSADRAADADNETAS